MRFDGLLRLKQHTNIAGQDVSNTFAHNEPGTAHYADVPSALVLAARSTSCSTRSRTWILGILTPLTAQQLRRPFGDKRTVHYGNKDTSPKEQTVRHIHVDFVEGWSIRLAQTFNSISCSETSVANRVSTGHEDMNCLINILRDLLVLRVSEE